MGHDDGSQLSDAEVTSFLGTFDEPIQQLARRALSSLRAIYPAAVEIRRAERLDDERVRALLQRAVAAHG